MCYVGWFVVVVDRALLGRGSEIGGGCGILLMQCVDDKIVFLEESTVLY